MAIALLRLGKLTAVAERQTWRYAEWLVRVTRLESALHIGNQLSSVWLPRWL
jgi:hypothetical protein